MLELLNDIIKNSGWYKSYFPHLREYWSVRANSDFICIGSSPARCSIDFSEEDVIGSNLAVSPETISYDFKVLKEYHKYLKEGGYVLFVLCPFTFLKDKYRKEDGNKYYLNIRYYPILPKSEIEGCEDKLYEQWINPVTMGIKVWLRIIRFIIKNKEEKENILEAEEFENNAKQRIQLWKEEFKLSELIPSSINQDVVTSIESNIDIFNQIVNFVRERKYKSVVIIPPFSEELTQLIPQDFVEYTLFKPIREIGIPFISYYKEKEWMKQEYYLNSFLMNKKGRKALTHDIVKRIMESEDK